MTGKEAHPKGGRAVGRKEAPAQGERRPHKGGLWARLVGRKEAPPRQEAKQATGSKRERAPERDQEQASHAFEDLMARYQKLLQQQQGTTGFVGFTRQLLDDAEREAASIRMRARREAEVEAARITAEAKQQAQETLADSRRRAQAATEQEAENIMQAARKRAQLLEERARQVSQLFLLRAREDIQNYVGEEAKEAYYKLLSTLQEVLATAQKIETDWKSRTVELWDATAFKLEEYQAALFGSLGPAQLEATSYKRAEPAAPASEPTLPAEAREEAAPAADADMEREKVAGPEEAGTAPSPEAPEEEEASGVKPAAVAEDVPAATVAQKAKAEEPKPVSVPVSSDLFSGEVELAVAPSKDISLIPKFYGELQAISGLRVIRTAGSWDRGTTITVVLDRPVALAELLAAMPNVQVVPGGGLSARGEGSHRRQRVALAFTTSTGPGEGQENTGSREG